MSIKWYHSLLCICDKNHTNYSDCVHPLYNIINEYLANGYAVIYAGEPNPTQVVVRMIKLGIEAENFIESGALLVIDADSLYVQSKLDSHKLLDIWHSFFIKVRKGRNNSNSNKDKNTQINFKGIIAIATAKNFLETNNYQKLISFEQTLGKKFEIPLEAICCYTEKSIENISLGNLISILNLHQYTIHKDRVYREWHNEKIIEIVSRGLDRSLGRAASKLVLKTLKLIYKIDNETIASNPERFEEAIKKLFKNSADSILGTIIEEFKTEISF